MRRSLWLVFVISIFLLVPSRAYAWDLGSFDDGLGDFFSEEQHDDVSSGGLTLFAVNGEGGVRAGETNLIKTVINACWYVNYGINERLNGLQTIRFVLTGNKNGTSFTSTGLVSIAVLLVFFWWGVRKTVRIVMAAWRKGHASV